MAENTSTRIPLANRLVGGAVFSLLAAAFVYVFVNVFRAAPFRTPAKPSAPPVRDAVQAALSTDSVARAYREIAAFGSRAPGQPGLERTRAYIEKAFADAGLEIFGQDVAVPSPLLRESSGFIETTSGRIEAWPFEPNYVQTVTTGARGIEGELFLADDAGMRSCTRFAGKIAVIDTSRPIFGEFELNAARYVDAGFEAVVVTHAQGLGHAPWGKRMEQLRLKSLPANLVRVAAGPEILGHIGEKARLDVRSRWVNASTRNVVGVLRGGAGNKGAVIVPVEYDALSALPDFASGSLEALQTALLTKLAAGLAERAKTAPPKRDVVFVAATGIAQAQSGLGRLVSTIGLQGKPGHAAARISAQIADNDALRQNAAAALTLFDNPDFLAPGAVRETDAALRALPANARSYFTGRFTALLRKAVFEEAEPLLQAQIASQRKPDDLASPEFRHFLAVRRRYDKLNNLSQLPPGRVLARDEAKAFAFPMPNGSRGSLREAARAEFARLADYHARRAKSLVEDLALARLFAQYDDIVVAAPRVCPSAAGGDAACETIGVASGHKVAKGEAQELFLEMLGEAAQDLGMADEIKFREGDASGFANLYSAEIDSKPFAVASFPAFSIVSAGEAAKSSAHPFAQENFADLSSIRRTLLLVGEAVSKLADGYGTFGRLPVWGAYTMRGTVFAAGIGNSAIPNYAVEGALVCSLDKKQKLFTDPYGHFANPFVLTPAQYWERSKPYDAFLFDADGEVRYVKDYGASAQFIYASRKMEWNDIPVNLILYRAAPVALLNCVNPQSHKSFSGIEFISRRERTAFDSTCPYSDDGGMMDFLPPDASFYLLLKAGAPNNDLASETRAFCLGRQGGGNPEADGEGYLAQDTPVFRGVAEEAAASMEAVASSRLDLQRRHAMADDMTLDFSRRAREIAAETKADEAHGAPQLQRARGIREALSYLMLNHPVVRGTITEAVAGILWYMALLVPFVFFFEKLVFCFADVRRQLLAQGVVFVAVFALFRLLHPAFQMLRSPAMILLGFVIVAVVGFVTAVLSGKFQENIDALRRARGEVKGAGVDKAGVVMTAFMLGLNNMHRRKVRTGLTCATLVLMTFVMICFTSVQSGVVERERATGRAAYQGVVVRKDDFRPVTGAEVEALRATFGGRHTVSRRNFYASYYSEQDLAVVSPAVHVDFGEGSRARRRTARAALGFDSTEPLARSLRLLCTNGWFTAGQQQLPAGPYPVMISAEMAEELGVSLADVETGRAEVTVAGTRCFVHNVFDSASLAEAADPDGESLLPFDGEALNATRLASWGVLLADRADPRVGAADVILVVNDQFAMDARGIRTASVAVGMDGASYTDARREISSYLEQTGQECSYGLDGTAFVGRRARARSMAGVADLLIPLVIAALTVLNTMKGSVYERRDEIFVYNAVGIAPRYVFFMFVAEALVYSVVGAVLGYLLSQGTGRLLMAFGRTGGLNLNFATASTIYASLAIAAAALLSTWFPARTAMEIARPADNAGWKLPSQDAQGQIAVQLPFTFGKRDRIAVLAFLHDYFDSYGEGSSGPFFAGEPVLRLADRPDDLADGACIPALEVRVWLRPFDLGVSQKCVIELGTDRDTGEFVATMALTRLTGTRDACQRLSRPFVADVRRRFLIWRAVPEDQKAELFAKAKALLEKSCLDA